MKRTEPGFRVCSLILIIASVMIIVRTFSGVLIDPLQASIDNLGVWGPVVYGVLYIVATVAMVPGSIITLGCGAVFGVWVGVIVASVGSTLGAMCAFLIARFLARSRVQRVAARSTKFAAFDQAVEQGGWRVVALARLSPVLPFNLQNYLWGVSPVRLRTYVLTSWLAMLPGTALYVWLGSVGGSAITRNERNTSVGQWVLLLTGVVATIGVTIYLTRLARANLARQTEVSLEEADEEMTPSQMTAKANSNRRWTMGLVVLGVVTASVAGCALLKRGEIEGWLARSFGPPSVEMQESYAGDAAGASFDHSAFDGLLRSHVREGGWVDYDGLVEDADVLDDYMSTVAEADFDSLSRDAKLSFLINTYNAATLRLVLDHLELVRDGPRGIRAIPAAQRWDAVRWTIGGIGTLSLNQIEHQAIRQNFREPLIHFALVCAARSCPPLRSEAYTGEQLEAQLADQASVVHSSSRWFRYDGGDRIELTPLYQWYGGDFEQTSGSVLKFVAEYSMLLHDRIEADDDPSIDWLPYDWSLNSVQNRVDE